MSKDFLQLLTSLKLEKIKIKYDHYEKIVRNMMWVVTLVIAIVLAATFKNEMSFSSAVILILIVGIVVSLLMLPIAKRSDNVTEKDIPALIQTVLKNKGR